MIPASKTTADISVISSGGVKHQDFIRLLSLPYSFKEKASAVTLMALSLHFFFYKPFSSLAQKNPLHTGGSGFLRRKQSGCSSFVFGVNGGSIWKLFGERQHRIATHHLGMYLGVAPPENEDFLQHSLQDHCS